MTAPDKKGEKIFKGCLAGTQGIHDNTYLPIYNGCQASHESQIKKALAFLNLYGGKSGRWPFAIPPFPDSFNPQTSTEVLLLAVYLPDDGKKSGLQRTFEAWWDFILTPASYTKSSWPEYNKNSDYLRMASDVNQHRPGVRWVAFDPEANLGVPPSTCWENSMTGNLATAEVLMAVAQFTSWPASWGYRGSSFPTMSGYMVCLEGIWWYAPYLRRSKAYRSLLLDLTRADVAPAICSSPVVREC